MSNGDNKDTNDTDIDIDLADMFKKIDKLDRIEFYFNDNTVGCLRGENARKWALSCVKLAARYMDDEDRDTSEELQ